MTWDIIVSLSAVVTACVILKYSCDWFEAGANYFGRNMPAGVKGATVNAIGSSLPEMMSAFACLFFFDDPTLFAVALGLTSGSAVFNAAVIPSLATLFARDSNGRPVNSITLDKNTLLRDLGWALLAEVVLIAMMATGYISMTMAIILNIIYVGYAIHLYVDAKRSGDNDPEEFEPEEFFGRSVDSLRTALPVFVFAMAVITAGSHILVEGVLGASDAFGIPNFISGLILGAAASSIPDLILSLKDAKNGDYEDAVANPLASNTFDTTISVGLPLVAWLLWQGQDGIAIVSENMGALRISVVAMTVAIGLNLLRKYKGVTKQTAWINLGMYAVWCLWVGVTYL